MELIIRNVSGDLTKDDLEYAEKKLTKLGKFFQAADKVELVHKSLKHSEKVEITVFAKGIHLRGEESGETTRAAIDLVSSKMETRLRRLKGRLIKSHRQRDEIEPSELIEVEFDEAQEEPTIKEHKRFLFKPMSVEEASLQMELIDHPFFVFRNIETGHTEVLYKREDGHYGLLSPDA